MKLNLASTKLVSAKLVSATLAALLVCGSAAQAQYKVYGLGGSKCWAPDNFDAALRLGFEAWLGGFITGSNAVLAGVRPGVADLTNSAHIHEIEALISAWCASHPSATIAEATINAIGNMKPTQPPLRE